MPDGLSVSVLPESSFDGLSVSVLPESSDPLSVLPESSLDGTSVPDGLSVSFFGVSGFVGVAFCLTGVHCATTVTSEPLSSTLSPDSTLSPSIVQPSNSYPSRVGTVSVTSAGRSESPYSPSPPFMS